MGERNAIEALVDLHHRAIRELLKKMDNWTDQTLLHPVKDFINVKGILVHVVGCIYDPYFGWMQDKLEFAEKVPSPIPRARLQEIESLDQWRELVAGCIPYVEEATRLMADHDLEKPFPAPWNEKEIYMIEQMFEHAIVHVWRHYRQLERIGIDSFHVSAGEVAPGGTHSPSASFNPPPPPPVD